MSSGPKQVTIGCCTSILGGHMLDIDLPINHIHVPRFVDKIGHGPAELVDRQGRYPSGKCYSNVWDYTRLFSGEAVYGWMLVQIPGLYSYAWHHCIWRSSSDARMLDVSTHPNGQRGGITTFIEDNSHRPDPHFGVGLDPIIIAQCDHPLIPVIEQNLKRVMSLVRRQMELLHSPSTNSSETSDSIGAEIRQLGNTRSHLVAAVHSEIS